MPPENDGTVDFSNAPAWLQEQARRGRLPGGTGGPPHGGGDDLSHRVGVLESDVKEIKADGWYSETTEVIQVDPTDPKEAKLMAQLKVEPNTKKAITAVLAPPGMLVAKIEGATTKDSLKAAFKKAAEGCTPGSGCCPSVK